METGGDGIAPCGPAPTCRTCQVVFDNPTAQREHHRGEWHRYNICRRAADLAPVLLSVFEIRGKAASLRAAEERAAQLVASETFFRCSACSSSYASRNALAAHLRSRKHTERTRNTASAPDAPSVIQERRARQPQDPSAAKHAPPTFTSIQSDTEEVARRIKNRVRIGLSNCLFCSTSSSTFQENLSHMQTSHSFFIPFAARCINTQGLFRYLASKLSVGFACLQCHIPSAPQTGLFNSLGAVRNHMADTGHYSLPLDDPVVQKYYAPQSYELRSLALALGLQQPAPVSDAPSDGKYEQDAAESSRTVNLDAIIDSGQMSDSSDEDLDCSSSMDDDYSSDDSLDGDDDKNQPGFHVDDELQLVLPSGVAVGNRLFRRYYRQNVPLLPLHEASDAALEESGSDSAKRHDVPGCFQVTPLTLQAARNARRHERLRKRAYLKLGVKANKLQHHFREQVLY